jgi:molybdopterin-guanine dinucleotide biosynthesis protein A
MHGEHGDPAIGFLLAGGQSSRMGCDKSLLIMDGETLAARSIRKLREVCSEVAIAGGRPELTEFARIIPDSDPGCGPLGGIVSALEQSRCEHNLFLAVDMPFVPVDVLRELIANAGPGSIVLAEAEGKLQPLCGVYSRSALLILRAELEAGHYKVKDAVAATRAVETVRFDNLRWFQNLNTPDDFNEAQGLE